MATILLHQRRARPHCLLPPDSHEHLWEVSASPVYRPIKTRTTHGLPTSFHKCTAQDPGACKGDLRENSWKRLMQACQHMQRIPRWKATYHAL